MKTLKHILKLLILTLTTISTLELLGQQQINQDWNAFAQTLDMANYQGGQFRFKGFVRTKDLASNSHAQLWARIDVVDGKGFFDNMYQRPIVSVEWSEYIIEGPIADNAIKLTIGGIGQGAGKYYFDNFTLEIKKKDGDWTMFQIANSGFENETLRDWLSYNVKGFTIGLTSENVFEGAHSLVINAELDK